MSINTCVLYHCLYISWRGQWHPTPVLLPGESHGRRSLVGCSPWGHKESDMTERLHFHFSLSCIGERDGSPLQCSCLENPRDRGAWWAFTYGVAQSRTRLKWLGSIHFLIYLKCFNFFQNALDKSFILTYLDAPTFDFIYISLWKFSRQTLFLLEYVQLDICLGISSKHLFLLILPNMSFVYRLVGLNMVKIESCVFDIISLVLSE